jgi:hypothetical protein
MNPEIKTQIEKPVWHFGINFVAACFLFVALTAIVKFSLQVPAIDADRAAILSKTLADNRATEYKSLNTADWIDQNRNLVRLPIETALQLSESAAKNPVAARADLIARAEKAAAPAPKVAPKPSAFE